MSWVENDCRGRATAVLVAVLNGKPVGYVACLLHPENSALGIEAHGDIDLVAVGPKARGKGVGLQLVRAALAWCRPHASRMIVKTQVINTPAINLYQRAGFQLAEANSTLHCWL